MKTIINRRQILVKLYTICVFGICFLTAVYLPVVKKWVLPPTVTVLMSTYNRAAALPTAIESILGQTFTDFEFIIINDGSKDNSDEVIRFYAERDPRIIYLKNRKNKGLIYSLNRGLDKARGRYIARMDDDDKSVAFRLERQVLAMRIYPEITVMGTGILDKDSIPEKNDNIPVIESPDKMELETYFSSGLAHPTIMIRRDFLEKNHIRYNPDYLYAEDCGLYKDILNQGGKLSALNEGLLHFGYISNLWHPDEYYKIQEETFKKIQKEKLAPFFDAPYEMLGTFKSIENKCEILKKMVANNPKKKILNQGALEEMQAMVCANAIDMSRAVFVRHPHWEDHVVINDDGTIFRLDKRSETGKIQKNDDGTVTIYWNQWGPEIYRIQDDKHYVYDEDKNSKLNS